MNTSKISRGDIFQINDESLLYYARSEGELNALRARDRLTGDTRDSGGEPRIYSSQGCHFAEAGTTVMVTSLQTTDNWTGWGKKPKGLVTAVVTNGSFLGRAVFVRRSTLESGVRVV